MAVTRKTLKLLPSIFQTDVNRKFLSSTLDQLVSEPNFKRVNGYVGRRFSSAYQPSDNYIQEPGQQRQNYQLELGVVNREDDGTIQKFANYNDLVARLSALGGVVSDQNRLFNNEYYTYSPPIDIDKLVNYKNYYWVPIGPETIKITSKKFYANTTYNFTDSFAYLSTNVTGDEPNPRLILRRGTTYTFNGVMTNGNLWIQSEPGRDGIKQYSGEASSRIVAGVTNNGSNSITFTPPLETAQDVALRYPVIDQVEYAIQETFATLDNAIWAFGQGQDKTLSGDQFYPDNTEIIFLNNSSLSADWTGSNGQVVPMAQRTGVWRMSTVKYSGQPVRIKLDFVRAVANNTRVIVNQGRNQGREYVTNAGTYIEFAGITAESSLLFYQHSNRDYYGEIEIIESDLAVQVNVGNILGALEYTTPDGVKFSNGMKVFFDNTVLPVEYRNKTYIVEGVGQGIKLVDYSTLVVPESLESVTQVSYESRGFDIGNFDETLLGSNIPDYIVSNRASLDKNAWSRINRWFHEDVIKQSLSANNLPLDLSSYQRAQRPIIEFADSIQLMNSGRIFGGFVDQFFEKDFVYTDAGQPKKITEVYNLVQNARFRDLNKLGINLKYQQKVVFAGDNDSTISRTIFSINRLDQAGARVFEPISFPGTISFQQNSDRVSGVGTNFTVILEPGTDIYLSDNTYMGRVKQVLSDAEFLIEETSNYTIINQSQIKINYPRVILSTTKVCANWDIVVSLSGHNSGRSFYISDILIWQPGQQKSSLNQAPLFDIINSSGQSISQVYPESSFAGTPLFSFAKGTGVNDLVLGFPITYSGSTTFTSDILFDNNFDKDKFAYRSVNRQADKTIENINLGYIRRNISASSFELLTSFTKVAEPSKQYQHIEAEYDAVTNYFEIGQAPKFTIGAESNIRVYINNNFVKLSNSVDPEYTLEFINQTQAIKINHNLLAKGDHVDIFVFANSPSNIGFYELPKNLEYNPFNETFAQVSFGQMRNHLERIGENHRLLVGEVFKSNNIRDIDIQKVSGTLLQHSASLLPAMVFLTDQETNFANSIDFACKEYERFKYKFLDTASKYVDSKMSVPDIVDEIMLGFARVKNKDFPWYYSDMVPFGNNFNRTTIRVTNTAQRTYNLNNTNAIAPSNTAINIYLNDSILASGVDYVINATSATFVLGTQILIQDGDIITIREYPDTDGSFVPETPSKLGMYPRFNPEMVFDDAAGDAIYYVQGHDGSLTPAFNDKRDDILLELERRIFSNIKVEYNETHFGFRQHIPGKFRTTEYSRTEFNNVLSIEFLKWVGENQLDYTTNRFFNTNDQWTWNYSQTKDQDGNRVPGFWRGIYRYFYDTERPHTHPWEMLGFITKPQWWDQYYSWTDSVKRTRLIEAVKNGRRLSPASANYTSRTDAVYTRDNFNQYVPVDIQGQLLNPQTVIIAGYSSEKLSKNFTVGDYGPVEAAWAKTSSYCFALQKAFALLKPAQYFGLMLDTYRTERRSFGNTSQYFVRGGNTKPNFINTVINGETVNNQVQRSASYLNWIHGYLISLGLDASSRIRSRISNTTLNLSYKFAGFTDKRYINVLADQISLSSTSESIVIPDESYSIYLNKSLPLETIVYSGVIIERSSRGYTVTGYDQKLPYFVIIPSRSTGTNYKLEVLGQTVTIYDKFFPQKIRIPYGFEFTSVQQVVDFLVGYQRYLVAQGLVFDDYDSNLSTVRNWTLSVQEFLTWVRQEWPIGNVLVLSPIYNQLSVHSENYFVDYIDNFVYGSQIVGTNFNVIRNNDFTVLRDNKRTTIRTTNDQTIALVRLNLIQYEHVLVLDNRTIFNDVLLNAALGERHYRVKLVGSVTDSWDGDLTPPGFIYSNGQIDSWIANADYKKGQIINYKGFNYSALENVEGDETFNLNKWTQLDSIFREGLAPNFSHNAVKFNDIYDVDVLPIDESLVAYSNSLIGFKPREFFDNLGMTAVSQIKFYQGYIKTKGTRTAITAFAKGRFDNVDSSIEVYEEWGARLGSYGAIENNPEYSFLITNSRFDNDPLLYQFVNSNALPDNKFFATASPSNLLSRPDNYSPNVFLNRNTIDQRTWRIALYGDSLLSGKEVLESEYRVDVIKRHGYSVDIQTRNQYSVYLSGVFNVEPKNVVYNDETFKINFTSQYPGEPLFLTLEIPTADDMPMAVSNRDDVFTSVNSVSPDTELSLSFTTRIPYEQVYLSFEPLSANELERTKTSDGSVFYPNTVRSLDNIFVEVESLRRTEDLYWTIEEVGLPELPSTTMPGLGEDDNVLVGLNDKTSGRVAEPPDFILYNLLQSEFDLAVTSRAVESATTASLLAGTDGVNPVWPDRVEADIVILNHGLEDAKRGVDLNTYKSNLREIRRKLKADKIVIWITPAPIDLTNPNTVVESPGTNNLEPYARIMREVALENADYSIDLWAWPEYLNYISVDGVHLTQLGYRSLVEKLLAPTVRQAILDRQLSSMKHYEDDIVNAGYPRLDEIDSLVFDISKYAEFDTTLLANLRPEYRIWVAKDFNGSWQVLRAVQAAQIITEVRADSPTRLIFTTNTIHHVRSGDIIAIRNINSSVNGFYQCVSATDKEITVSVTEVNTDFAITGRSGVMFEFERMRYASIQEVKNHQPKYGYTSSDLIYVDSGHIPGAWQVYRPRVVDTIYNVLNFSNVTLSNTYSIVGINCIVANSFVGNVSLGEQINFCIFSKDDSEELYYTIETATDDDLTTATIFDGIAESFANNTVISESPIYEFDLVRESSAVVDLDSINNLYMYDIKERNILSRLDLYDPNKGRILGQARADIDFITEADPAKYRNTDTSTAFVYTEELYWAADQVGSYWWNLTNCRYINYEQGDLEYRKNNWGRLFPGSKIEVYEWIASDVLPSVHVSEGREGTPLYPNDEYYSDSIFVDPETNTFVSRYFFWVKGRTNKTAVNKNSSTVSLEDMITNPTTQGVPYMAALRDDAIALYGVGPYAQTDTSVLYVAARRFINDKIIHSDFKLLQEGNQSNKFPNRIESKLVDSIAGIDANGNIVPDPKLVSFNRIGLGLRPRQTLIADIKEARKNFVKYVNDIFSSYPVVTKIQDRYRVYSDNLFAREPEPASTQYTVAVDTIQDVYKPAQTAASIIILVRSDTSYGGYWTLYQRTGTVGALVSATNTQLRLIRRQAFDVTKFWDYADWYASGYSSLTKPTYTIDQFQDIYKLILESGDIVKVKVTNNSAVSYGSIVTRNQELSSSWELYLYTKIDGEVNLELIGLGGKTLQLKSEFYEPEGFDIGDFDVPSYDNSSLLEFRYIMSALKQDIFVYDLEEEYNKLLFALVDYILTEQKYIDWFFKTSFISVKQKIHGLNQLPSLVKDRQSNIENYIQEVKPYRTKIREFINNYSQVDSFVSAVTDFDLPAYYDRDLAVYRSPNGEYPEIDLVKLQRPEYQAWLGNHKYSVGELVISRPGYGYKTPDNQVAVPPSIEIFRTDVNTGQEANAVVSLDEVNYGISKVYITDAGSNFTETPEVKLVGIGARKPRDRQRYDYTVVAQGYSYFTVGLNNKLGFGLFGRSGKLPLDRNYRNSKINVSDWTVGSGGTATFLQYGSSAENQRVFDLDPWGQSNVVWETRPNGDNNADGGWNGVYFSIDPTKTYRSVVWMRRTTNDSGGLLYHGLQTNGTFPAYANPYSSNGTVRRLTDGLGEWNPYWNYRNASEYDKGEWYLHVGHIFPAAHAGTDPHPDSGIYTRKGGRVMSNSGNINDAKFPANATTAMQRCYHSYSTDAYTKAQFAFPRFEEVNGQEPTIKDLLESGPYQDVLYNQRRRGYHMHRIRRVDGQVAFSKVYDIYGQNVLGFTGSGSDDLAADLAATTDDYVVVVHTYDEPRRNRLTNRLHLALTRCGASFEVFGKPISAAGNQEQDYVHPTFKFRSAYILVGIPGCGPGRGIEHYAGSFDNSPDSYASIDFRIERGFLQALRTDPQHYVFGYSFNPPANPAAGESYTYGERTYQYDGYRWISNKVVSPTLDRAIMPMSAVLSPRLENLTVRKVHTVVRFDRTQYSSQVQDWVPNRVYNLGTYISYNGQAYKVSNVTLHSAAVSSTFSTAGLTAVASTEFDNANDRIMGFYVPESASSPPKDLGVLIPGISDLYSTYTGSAEVTQDTILLGDTFGSTAGISAGNIKISGGKFVDRLFSHAPEELLPGAVYDSLNIRVLIQSGAAPGTTTTTTAGPSSLTLSLMGKTESTSTVPYNEPGFTTYDQFLINLSGGGNADATYPVTVTAVSKPAGGSVVITPSLFNLLPGQQQLVTIAATNDMFAGKTWYDVSSYNNNFELLDNSPTWSLVQRGMFSFNGGSKVNDRASSIGTMTGINTTPGGYNTIAMWMRWTGDPNGFPVEFKTNYRLWMPAGALGFNNGGGDLYGITPAAMAMYKNTWTFVVAVFHNTLSGSTYVGNNKLYINGVPRTLSQVQGSPTAGTAGIGITLGNSSNPSATPDTYEFDGDITEVFAYNRELTSDEVLGIYFATKDRYPSPATTSTTSTTSTSTSTSTSTTTLPPPPPLPAGVPPGNTAWGGNGFGGTYNYRGGYSVSGGHFGNAGGGSASPVGGAGGSWSSQGTSQSSYGTGGFGGGYLIAGMAGTGGIAGYNSIAIHAVGIGNGGGSVETDGGNDSIAPIYGGDGAGGLVRIRIASGSYTFTNADLTAFGATRITDGGQGIEWDNSTYTSNKKNTSNVYQHALVGTFTVPAGVTALTIGVIAGGGGGAVGPCVNAGGGGGGAALLINYAVSSGTQYIVKAGAGGQGGRQSISRAAAGGAPYGVDDAPWRGGWSSFCQSSGTEIVYATGGNTRPDSCAGIGNADSASANTMD